MVTFPPVIGHRGAADHAPENTLAAFRAAAAQGVRCIEFDVKLSRDGVPVVMHDERLERTTDGEGPVAAADWERLRGLDAGSWFGQEFAGERVPTLEAALGAALDLGLAVNLELKPCPGRTLDTVEAALGVAGRIWPAARAAPLLSSFDVEALAAARRLRPEWPRGLITAAAPTDWPATAERLEVVSLHLDHRRVAPALVRRVRETGRAVLAWTVNDPARARELRDWGVAGVFSDRPGAILAALGHR